MPNLNTLLDEHVVLKYEFVDRIFLNAYVARLQEPDQLYWFLCQHKGERIPRYGRLGEMTRQFVAAMMKLAEDRQIPVVEFERGQRKEAIAEPNFAIASGIAVLGYHLWDLDVVVNRSLVYGLVTVVTSAAYVAIVAGFGRLFTTSSLAVSLVATVAIALAILPISGAMQRWVNRLMYGAREDPYGALARLGDRLARSPETESVLNTIVDTIAESLRVPYVSVQIRNGPIVEIAARPAIGEWANRINLHIEYHGEAIGKLVVAPRSPRDP